MLPGGTGVRKVSEAQSPTERWQAILSRTEGRIDQAAKAKSADGGATLAHTREGTRSPYILPALALAFNAGLRHAEIRHLTWGQIDFEKQYLTVGKGKTDAGAGRTIPLNGRVGKPEFGTQRPPGPHATRFNAQNLVEERQDASRCYWAFPRYPPHADYRIRRELRRRSDHHGHRRSRFEADASKVFAHPNGGEAQGAGRHRRKAETR